MKIGAKNHIYTEILINNIQNFYFTSQENERKYYEYLLLEYLSNQYKDNKTIQTTSSDRGNSLGKKTAILATS